MRERELIDLDEAACIELLRGCSIGRVAVNLDNVGPLVVPVNFVVDGGYIVFRSDPGTKLRLLAAGPISFEVDGFDEDRRTGWSVLVRGMAHEAAASELGHVELEPWADGQKAHWVRLLPKTITGRRLDVTSVILDEHG